MGNMGYCRFENTLEDLRDCYENWDSLVEEETDDKIPCESELKAREKMLKLCQDIVNDYVW